MESREAAEAKALAVADELERMRLGEAARVVREGSPETDGGPMGLSESAQES